MTEQQLILEKYKLVNEGKPFGLMSRVGAQLGRLSPTSSGRAVAQTKRNFHTNVNNEFTRFKSRLVTQPNQNATSENLKTFFNKFVGLPTNESPTLSKLSNRSTLSSRDLPRTFLSAIRDYESMLSGGSQPPAPSNLDWSDFYTPHPDDAEYADRNEDNTQDAEILPNTGVTTTKSSQSVKSAIDRTKRITDPTVVYLKNKKPYRRKFPLPPKQIT